MLLLLGHSRGHPTDEGNRTDVSLTAASASLRLPPSCGTAAIKLTNVTRPSSVRCSLQASLRNLPSRPSSIRRGSGARATGAVASRRRCRPALAEHLPRRLGAPLCAGLSPARARRCPLTPPAARAAPPSPPRSRPPRATPGARGPRAPRPGPRLVPWARSGSGRSRGACRARHAVLPSELGGGLPERRRDAPAPVGIPAPALEVAAHRRERTTARGDGFKIALHRLLSPLREATTDGTYPLRSRRVRQVCRKNTEVGLRLAR